MAKKNLERWLPIPTTKHVEEFAKTCKGQLGMELPQEKFLIQLPEFVASTSFSDKPT